MESRVIIDTNVLIGFLIGKRLRKLKDRISDSSIVLILTNQLINELRIVASRPKFRKYFDRKDVDEFVELISEIGLTFEVDNEITICRDPKDNFLLELCRTGLADYLITGDQDLLEIGEFGKTRIITPDNFEKLL
jgi:putative PIN family toxin of toxin-antitoxin system